MVQAEALHKASWPAVNERVLDLIAGDANPFSCNLLQSLSVKVRQ